MGFFNRNNDGAVKETKAVAPVDTDSKEAVQDLPLEEPRDTTPTPKPRVTPSGDNTNKFLNRLKVSRQQAADPPPSKNSGNTETGGDESTDEEVTTKLSQDGIEATAGFFTELGDIVIPEAAGWLNEEDSKQYELKPKQKKLVLEAYIRKIEETQRSGTANQQIFMALAVGYGIPLGMGALFKILKLFKEMKEKREAQIAQPPIPQVQYVNPVSPQGQAEPLPAPIPQPSHTISPTEPQATGIAPEENREVQVLPSEGNRQCLFSECNQVFAVGTGYGKTKGSKSYDLFHDPSCMNKHNGRNNSKKSA